MNNNLKEEADKRIKKFNDRAAKERHLIVKICAEYNSGNKEASDKTQLELDNMRHEYCEHEIYHMDCEKCDLLYMEAFDLVYPEDRKRLENIE